MASSHDISYQAGEAKGHAQVKKDEMVDKASQTAQAVKDKASGTAQSCQESCQAGKEETGSFLQQTGEQMKSMAQGAVDAVKNTLGVGESNPTSKK